MSDLQQPKPMTDLIAFSVTEAALNDLEKRYAEVPDASTKDGYELIKAGLKELTPLRTAVEKRRKELKSDALDFGRKVDAEAKRISGRIENLENPYKAAKQVIDDEKKRKEQERIDRLQAKVNSIAAYPQTAFGQPSGVIGELIEDLDRMEIEDFYDLTKEASEAKQKAMSQLTDMLQSTIRQEMEDAARKKASEELEAQQEVMRQQQERMAAQQAEMQAKIEEMERIEREHQENLALLKREQEAAANKQGEPAASLADSLEQVSQMKGDRAKVMRAELPPLPMNPQTEYAPTDEEIIMVVAENFGWSFATAAKRIKQIQITQAA